MIAALLLLQEPVLENWDQAQARFVEWQKRILAEKDAARPRPLVHRAVPPPPSACESPPEERYPARITFTPFFGSDVLPLEGVFPRLELGIAPQEATVALSQEHRSIEWVIAEQRAGVAFSARDPGLAFVDSTRLKKQIPLLRTPAGVDVDLLLFGDVQIFGHRAGIGPGGADLSLAVRQVSGALGVDTEGRLRLSGSVSTPWVSDPLAPGGQVRQKLGLTGTAKVKVTDIQYGSPWGLARAASGAAEAVRDFLRNLEVCAYCGANGTLGCRRCGDARTVRCEDCRGGRRVACGACKGAKRLACPAKVACGSCREGRLPCAACGGDGRVRRTSAARCWDCFGEGRKKIYYSGPCPSCDGKKRSFDGDRQTYVPCPRCNGQGSVAETRSTPCGTCGSRGTLMKEKEEDCSACGGGGKGAACSACGASGKVRCGRCAGSGWVGCGRCGGEGRVPCAPCEGRGRMICPTCQGAPLTCLLCRGEGRMPRPAAPRERPGVAWTPRLRRIFDALEPFLPPGAVASSALRTPEKQLQILKGFAALEGLDLSGATVEDEASWRDAWRRLVQAGYAVDPPAPTTRADGSAKDVSTHVRGIAIDLAGPDLDEIVRAVRRAEAAGKIPPLSLRVEKKGPRNSCVHLQIPGEGR